MRLSHTKYGITGYITNNPDINSSIKWMTFENELLEDFYVSKDIIIVIKLLMSPYQVYIIELQHIVSSTYEKTGYVLLFKNIKLSSIQ